MTDIFLHDRDSGETKLISVSSSGEQANDFSVGASISFYGDFVAFESEANNLAANDTNGCRDIFVHDCSTSETHMLSVDASGLSGDGDSSGASIAWFTVFGGAKCVAFQSSASNLVPGDENNHLDVFVHDTEGLFMRPIIKINGQRRSPELVQILPGGDLVVTIELVAITPYPGDHWVAAYTPFGWVYWKMNVNEWVFGFDVSHQGVIATFAPTEVLNIDSYLPDGLYSFYYFVDGTPDGYINEPMFGDWIDMRQGFF
jgi:hypothetical protein